jgi:2-polyprenyl-3-methyl-5-hydroxy-6-metoxy-1,4-benzoquinol methylase
MSVIPKTTCPVCNSTKFEIFHKRDNEPVHQNAVMASGESARDIPRGKLILAACTNCGFIFNQCFDPSKLMYGFSYDNSQTYSPQFNDYHSNLAKFLVHTKNIRNQVVVEVGCGKGHFIQEIVKESNFDNQGYGFDPSYEGPEICMEGQLVFKKDFYNQKYADIRADAVICRHVIEHVSDPNSLLGTIRHTLSDSANARVFFETPCVEWILENNVIWDFFYEHCSYFSRESLKNTFEMNGFHVETIEHTFGGQYLWLEATIGTPTSFPTNDTRKIPVLSRNFGKNYQKSQTDCMRMIDCLRSKGNLALWGAGAKGVTLANIIDPHCEKISAAIDINPNKQGHFIPGTGHPIISSSQIPEYGIKNALLMNPIYRLEIEHLLKKSGIQINLIELNFGDKS